MSDTIKSIEKELGFYLPWLTGKTANDIETELSRAKMKHGDNIFHSKHEAIAVLEEEFLELREAVYKDMSLEEVRKEAIQVAAMAVRFLNEISPENGNYR